MPDVPTTSVFTVAADASPPVSITKLSRVPSTSNSTELNAAVAWSSRVTVTAELSTLPSDARLVVIGGPGHTFGDRWHLGHKRLPRVN